jgi:hypothetical protein
VKASPDELEREEAQRALFKLAGEYRKLANANRQAERSLLQTMLQRIAPKTVEVMKRADSIIDPMEREHAKAMHAVADQLEALAMEYTTHEREEMLQ